MDGPQISTSNKPTLYPLELNDWATCVDTVLLPTPPFPDNTRMTCDTFDSAFWSTIFSFSLAATAAGDEKAPVEHDDWLGQPAQADALPAL